MAKLVKAPKVGTTYTVHMVSVRPNEAGSLQTAYVTCPTLADARKYALSVKPEYAATILKPIEYRKTALGYE